MLSILLCRAVSCMDGRTYCFIETAVLLKTNELFKARKLQSSTPYRAGNIDIIIIIISLNPLLYSVRPPPLLFLWFFDGCSKNLQTTHT